MGAHDTASNQILELKSQFTSPAQPMALCHVASEGEDANGNGATNREHRFEEIKNRCQIATIISSPTPFIPLFSFEAEFYY